ncbi:MAG TPA: efflux RND transporter periplasmic adaptor subunit [Thermoanaerobaculia bacterium]|nr:efflux RND transporter periplasmic adaptor subunit [Thermoanaerobaculia bacterium]
MHRPQWIERRGEPLKRKLTIPLAIVVVFITAGWTRNKLAADRQGEWARVTRGDLVTGVDVTGTLAALDSGSFGPPQLNDVWDFKIAMMAPEGSEITTGRPVLGFDTTELQKKLEQKSAEAEQARKEIEKQKADLSLKREDERLNLAQAEASLRKSTLKLEAPPDLVGVKERKQVELDNDLAKEQVAAIRNRITSLERAARAQIALLESKQQRAASIVAETQSAIRQMTIMAPRNGTIVYVTNWRGDKKKVGDTCWRMERVIEIPDLSRMIARGDVDEVDAGKIAVGQRVTLRLDAHPDEEFHGTIQKASKTVSQQQGTKDPLKVLRVEIVLDRSDPVKMRPGMRFQGTVELQRQRNAVLVPRNAVFVSARGPYALRRGWFNVQQIPVKLGRQNDKFVEVLGGISASDRVLVKSDKKEEGKS